MNKFDSLAVAVAPEGHEASPRYEVELPTVVYPTVEEHAEAFGLNVRAKRFTKALLFAHAAYAQGQRVSAEAFQQALDAALNVLFAPFRRLRSADRCPCGLLAA
jgi:hypothetical protein